MKFVQNFTQVTFFLFFCFFFFHCHRVFNIHKPEAHEISIFNLILRPRTPSPLPRDIGAVVVKVTTWSRVWSCNPSIWTLAPSPLAYATDIIHDPSFMTTIIFLCVWVSFRTYMFQERPITPSADNLFPDFDWIIGNHSDELTPWIPVIAAR